MIQISATTSENCLLKQGIHRCDVSTLRFLAIRNVYMGTKNNMYKIPIAALFMLPHSLKLPKCSSVMNGYTHCSISTQ